MQTVWTPDSLIARRNIPYAVLFTQSRAAVKSRTAKHIASQFRENHEIKTFNVEIVERDAYAAIFTIGGTVRDMNPIKVNGLENAVANIEAFRNEVIKKLRAIRKDIPVGEVA